MEFLRFNALFSIWNAFERFVRSFQCIQMYYLALQTRSNVLFSITVRVFFIENATKKYHLYSYTLMRSNALV